MNQVAHQEFDDLKQAKKLTKQDIENELRRLYPVAMATADEFRAAFGDSDNTILLLEQDGRQRKSKDYRPDEDYGGCLTAGEFTRAGELSRENAQQIIDREVNRGRK